MPRCCGQAGTCACKVTGGRHVQVGGTGTAQDPFTIDALTSINVSADEQFLFALTGEGTLSDPYVLHVGYAAGASLDGLPDVNAPAPTNGYVLAWDEASGTWVPAPPTTAAAGGTSTGNGIEGDGSAGAPLEVTADNVRFIQVGTNGVGLTDAGINSLIRAFPDDAARAVADPPPVAGTLSVLADNPSRIDYYTGAEWLPIDNGVTLDIVPGQMLALSGPYVENAPVSQRVQQLDVTTDALGDFEVLGTDDLLDYAGVLSVHVQEMGEVGWKATVRPDDVNGVVMGRAFRLDDGTAYDGMTLQAMVTAWLY